MLRKDSTVYRSLATLAAASALTAAACLLPAGAAGQNERPSNSSLYSYKSGKDCARRYLVDPISTIFFGSAAYPRVLAGYERGGPFQADVKGDITKHTGWTRHNSDNIFRQEARTDHGCVVNPTDTDLASTSGYGHDRWHLRMWPLHVNGDEPFYTTTTPHREDWYYGDGTDNDNDCGTGPGTGSHAVERGAVDRGPQHYERHGSGFDRGRRFLYRAYKKHAPRHEIYNRNIGNSRSVKQCDGEYAGSNGTVAFIGVGRRQ
jgi:hypothetical protein